MGVKSVFGANVKYYRKQRKLSQEQLSEFIEISPKHLSTIETGATFVSSDLLEKLIKKLGVSASALFYSPEEKSADDSVFSLFDRIVEEELFRAIQTIKVRLRRMKDV